MGWKWNKDKKNLNRLEIEGNNCLLRKISDAVKGEPITTPEIDNLKFVTNYLTRMELYDYARF